MFKIGTLADWFGLGLIEGIKESSICGASGVQIYAWNDLNPETVHYDTVKEVRSVAKQYNQEIVALCGELGGHGLSIREDNPSKIQYLKSTVDMAVDLECSIVTTHIGIIPEDTDSETYAVLLDACSEVSQYAQSKGVFIAVETGPEPVERLCSFIDACKGSLSVNYDPANLVMVTNDDEVKGVYTAGSKIVHTHAKDGICNFFAGCEKVYGIFADGGIEALNSISTYFTETPLGEGNVRFPEYLKALEDVGYNGYLTIEREVSKNARNDIKMAVDFLRSLIQ